MGGGLEADLSHRAVAALWMWPERRWRPVLQVADLRHVPDGTGLSPAPEQRYSITLSDGTHSQPGMLDASLNHLVRDGTLRRGSVVRLRDFVRDDYHRRTIIVTQLQILQTECPLIGSLKPYEPTTRNFGVFTTRSIRHALRPEPGCEPYLGGQHNHQSCIPSEAEESANGLSYHSPCRGSSLPGGGTLSPVGLLAERAVWKTVQQIKDEYLGYSDVPGFITVKAFISFIKTERLCSAAYPMMVNGKVCNVKAADSDDGMWHCKRSGQCFESCYYGTRHIKRCGHSSYSCDCGYSCGQNFDSCNCGYSVRILIQDCTGATFATVYDKAAKEIFGCTAKELYLMRYEEQDYVQLRDIIRGIEYKQYVLQLKVEAKPFSDGHRAECVVLKAERVNPSAESRRILGEIDTLLGKGSGSCREFGGSMPASNSSHAIHPGRGHYLCSSDRFGQQENLYAWIMKPSAFSAFGASDYGFVGRFGGATRPLPTPSASIASDVISVRRARTLAQRVERSPGKP